MAKLSHTFPTEAILSLERKKLVKIKNHHISLDGPQIANKYTLLSEVFKVEENKVPFMGSYVIQVRYMTFLEFWVL